MLETSGAPSLAGPLESGEADAVLTPEIPGREGFAGARRLYGPRGRKIEMGRFQETGQIPTVHVMVARTAVLEAYPTIAAGLTGLFDTAYQTAWDRYDDPAWPMSL